MKHFFRIIVAVFLAATAVSTAQNEQSRNDALIAVASNFSDTAKLIGSEFERETSATVEFSFGSTGQHYTQIMNGAPFDAFLSADAKRPADLQANGHCIAGTKFTYAIGRLALWSAKDGFVDSEGKVLNGEKFVHLAIAKPEVAPYGLAAQQVLQHLHLWDKVKDKLVFGENISQTWQFVNSGNAELGFVAWSQVKSAKGSFWLVPPKLHDPIVQDAVLLKDNEAARAFLKFLQGEKARKIITNAGYDLP